MILQFPTVSEAKRLLSFAFILLVAGCAAPVQTRLEVRHPLTGSLPDSTTYAFASDIAEVADIADIEMNEAIRGAIAVRLPGQLTNDLDTADVIVSYGLSDRPALTTIIGRSPAKRRRLFGRCAKRTIRLSIAMVRRVDGQSIYAASADQHHCKEAMSDLLPHLASSLMPVGTWPAQSTILYRKRP